MMRDEGDEGEMNKLLSKQSSASQLLYHQSSLTSCCIVASILTFIWVNFVACFQTTNQFSSSVDLIFLGLP
jgi:hypothetical protein